MKTEYKTDARLLCAASFVRCGAIVADIGSDHAYLPIYLLQSGIAERAVATDINEGPIRNAQANVKEAGLSHKISLVLTDGLCGIEQYAPTDILICGMGGELIERIISEAPFTKDDKVRLILQPMSRQEKLRAYLLGAGYNIIDEKLSCDNGRIYQCICAEFDGEAREYTDAELLLGRHNIEAKTEFFFTLVCAKIAALEKKRTGKREAGLNTEKEDRLLFELNKMKG